MTEPIRVGVLGARGRMGQAVCRAVDGAADLDLVAMIDVGDWLFSVADADAQVLVDFTHPGVVMDNIRFAIDQGIHAVVGTTGFTDETTRHGPRLAGRRPGSRRADRPELRDRGRAVDAVRADRRAVLPVGRGDRAASPGQGRRAERHRDPHGPADRGGPGRRPVSAPAPDATTQALDGARGADVDGIRVHGLRMAGLVAHQEILFGTEGETLTIRHDSLERSSFMPGVLLAVRNDRAAARSHRRHRRPARRRRGLAVRAHAA